MLRNSSRWAFVALLTLLTAGTGLSQPQFRIWDKAFDPATILDWSTTSLSWRHPTLLSVEAWTNSNFNPLVAIFNGPATTGTQQININEAIMVRGLTFQYASPNAANLGNYRLQGTGNLIVHGGPDSFANFTVGGAAATVTIAVPVDRQPMTVYEIRKLGAGTLVLSAANPFPGIWRIDEGTLRLTGGDQRLAPNSSVTLSAATRLDLNGTNQQLAALSDGFIGTGSIGGVTLGGGNLFVSLQNGSVGVYSGVISGTGNLSVGLPSSLEGSGWTLTGRHSYTGSTTISGKTWLTLNEPFGATRILPATTDVILQNGATLEMFQGYQPLRTVSGTGFIKIGNQGRVDVGGGVTSGTQTLNGYIYGNGTFYKSGNDTLILNQGIRSGHGLTFQVSQGVLTVEGIQSGLQMGVGRGLLNGNGEVDMITMISNDGRISPGSLTAPGRLKTTRGLRLVQGGTYQWKLASLSTSTPGTSADQITVNRGEILLEGGQVTLDFANLAAASRPDAASLNPFWGSEQKWTIVDWLGDSPWMNPQQPTTLGTISNPNWPAGTFSLSVGTNTDVHDVILTFTPVPEPGSILALVGIGCALWFRKRRKN
ncbi:MAG: PEP-CTERM sorting domain-containing protein [Fimbriiglobus sp.]